MRDEVSLREFMELKERVSLNEERVASSAKELVLQAERYDGHLKALNGEQARLGADRDRYLQKEVHQPWKDSVDLFIAAVNKSLATSSGRTAALVSVTAVVAAIIGALISAYFKT